MSYKLSPLAKNVLDTLLGFLGLGAGYVLSNAASFGKYSAEAALVGGMLGYFASDALAYLDTGTAPTATVIEAQALSSIQAAQQLPNLTDTEKQVLSLAQGIIEAKQKAGS